MTDEELIKHVLYDYPINYLMYPGGAGGEFLSKTITQHSNMFKKHTKFSVTTEVNRYHVPIPRLFHIVSAAKIRKHPESIEYFINIIKQKQEYLNFDVKEIVDEAILFLSGSKPSLLRCHMSRHSYFLNNSYIILPNTEVWYNYIKELLFFKLAEKVSICNTDSEKIKFFEYEITSSVNDPNVVKALNDGLEWVIKNNVNELTQEKLYEITTTYALPNFSFEYIFSDKFVRVQNYSEVFKLFYDYFEPYYRNNRLPNLLYTRIFEKGYLEDIFEIENNIFHDEVIEWHENNLRLLSSNNIDISLYKL